MEDPLYIKKIEKVMKTPIQTKEKKKVKPKRVKFKRKNVLIKRNKSLPNIKKLLDMSENGNGEKYLQWKDEKYFEYIRRLLEIII